MDEFRRQHINDRLRNREGNDSMDQALIIQTINACSIHCNDLITYLLDHEDLANRRRQLKLLRDCESICSFTTSQMASKSFLTSSLIKLCAFTCEHCGRECSQFDDAMSIRCSYVCLSCAKRCEEAIAE